MPRRTGETSYKKTAHGIIPRSKLIPLEIVGTKRAWEFVLAERRRGNIRVTSELIKRIHTVGFGDLFPDTAGKWRTVEVTVSAHTPPQFFTLPELMENFCADLRERLTHLPDLTTARWVEEFVALLAWAHHRFLWIHPFLDYNGRIARLLNNIILLNFDLPPIELKVETPARRRKYVAALHAADEGDTKPLEKIILAAFGEAAAATLAKMLS